MIPPFDVALALRRIGGSFWHDFAPIVVLGFGMVTLPEIALALAGTHAGSTVVATFAGLLRVLFVVMVTYGVMARLMGPPLGPAVFARDSFAASPRALSVAMLLGAGVVLVLVGLLLAGLAGPGAMFIRGALIALAFVIAVVFAPAVPLALNGGGSPMLIFAQAEAVTRGNRGRIAVVLGLLALTIVPARVVIAASVYGLAASTVRVAAIDSAMTVASPGLWLMALFDLLAWGLGAVVPAVIWRGLCE